MKNNDLSSLSFEEMMEKLDECIEILEEGDSDLDESLEKFETAVRLVKICGEKLNSAKGKVKKLTEGLNGEVSDSPFIVDDNEN